MNLNYYLSFDVCVSLRLSEKKLLNGCTYQKMLVNKVVTFLKRIKMAVLFFDFFGSDPSKMDQTCKFSEQTSRFLVGRYYLVYRTGR